MEATSKFQPSTHNNLGIEESFPSVQFHSFDASSSVLHSIIKIIKLQS